ncbi:hypothetical protein LMH87_001603 [Akanthomyces muscarius]|uniref:PARP catalytic domain-containing protein n=1 Tax=Akanthomyces muscarius TaxID=2231603 RepID=A0A9W8Q6N7_AKAMU|nr:hypothetical protein LMH87_001603 [Akanthomyces muscarius]KAJ4147050.1 hypothetical protein LMH87_001603 [Akanthomyces muscarius]
MGSTLDSFLESLKPPSLESWSGQYDDNEGHDTHWEFDFAHIRLSLTLSHLIASDTYLITDVTVRDTNAAVRRRDLDPIRQDVRAIFCSPHAAAPVRPMETYITILQALERIAAHEAPGRAVDSDEEASGGHTATRGWDAGCIDTWDEVLANPYGVDVSTIKDTAHHLLGRTPEQLVAGISDEFRIVHMESVVRPDLLQRFMHYQRSLQEQLQQSAEQHNLHKWMPPGRDRVRGASRRDDIVKAMIRPCVTFHGTSIHSVPSIIRHGFVKPGRLVGDKVVASPRSGIAFNDRGIYSSPSVGYALSYASPGHGLEQQCVATPLGSLPSLRLFVCATILGRTYTPSEQQHQWWYSRNKPLPDVHGPLAEGFDAHFDGGYEYIVHHEAAMLPCYVIHLDLGSDAARRAVELAQTDPAVYQAQVYAARVRRLHPKLVAAREAAMAPGDRRRAKEARKAAALKWFSCGYGPASGTRFKVEEIGEASDDEEEYGEWQKDKHAYLATDKEGIWLEAQGSETHAVFGEDDETGKKEHQVNVVEGVLVGK